MRRKNTLAPVVEEYKTSTVIVLEETRRFGFIEGFFSAPEFHRSVEERRPLVLAFGAWLLGECRRGALCTARLRDVVELELAQARARRELAPVEPMRGARRVRLAP